jgi:hypothetical protein
MKGLPRMLVTGVALLLGAAALAAKPDYARAERELEAELETTRAENPGSGLLVIYLPEATIQARKRVRAHPVSIDGVASGTLHGASPYLVAIVAPGKHLVGVSYGNRARTSQIVEASAGQAVFLRYAKVDASMPLFADAQVSAAAQLSLVVEAIAFGEVARTRAWFKAR